MTKEHLNEIMVGLCRKLKIRKSDLVAVHEAGMVAQGIDSNAIPYGLDFLLLNGTEDGTVREFTFDGFDIRLHAPEEFGADESISLVAPEGMDFPALAPEGILETIFERECAEYESGSWTGTLTSLRVGRPRLSDGEDNANLSFKCPKTGADLIERAAAACGMHKSEFLRSAAIEKAEKILRSA